MKEIEPTGRFQVTPPPLRQQRREDGPKRRPAGELDPEWIMVGVDVPAGKRLYASKDLKGSRFQVAMSQSGDADGWYLTSTMQHMLIITKPTYGECMADALRIWKNWEDDRGTQPERGIAMAHNGPMKAINPT